MKHLLTFNDISEDFSLYLESEDFELRKVFSKGMQAWNAGHRPGVAQHQWAFGRVNSFITGAGGARKADADLWAKAKAAKARKKKKK